MTNNKIERIRLENVTKKFTRRIKKDNKSVLSRVINFFYPKENKLEFEVLKSISLSVCSGEILGVIGKNGSGKSTLLKVAAGIYKSDNGVIKTNGSLIYVTGFGQGIKVKLTMKENIYLLGAVMGLSKKDVDAKIDQIVELSGFKDYLNTPIFQFSSGMISRLGFSISIHCLEHHNPDILLFDEVFSAGGDIDFEDKGVKKMEDLIKKGAAVILVSHSLDMIKKYCNRVILLDKGKIIEEGDPQKVIDKYVSLLNK
ncbi:MAG: ATP-binding cassette domain-containing protein [Candidatus Staskawiczbacteria bacterium]|nr:ATP-binding cassette domain-containing protein [Candidatus Staskawiczbacteria bacterium]